MTTLTLPPLYHYTCDHRRPRILADDRILRPGADGYVWLTDLDWPVREALGLTSLTLDCDRTQHGFKVTTVLPGENVFPWWAIRRFVSPEMRDLEEAPGAMPRHWYVAVEPVKAVEFDYRAAARS